MLGALGLLPTSRTHEEPKVATVSFHIQQRTKHLCPNEPQHIVSCISFFFFFYFSILKIWNLFLFRLISFFFLQILLWFLFYSDWNSKFDLQTKRGFFFLFIIKMRFQGLLCFFQIIPIKDLNIKLSSQLAFLSFTIWNKSIFINLFYWKYSKKSKDFFLTSKLRFYLSK